jgi:hypothetical protein
MWIPNILMTHTIPLFGGYGAYVVSSRKCEAYKKKMNKFLDSKK